MPAVKLINDGVFYANNKIIDSYLSDTFPTKVSCESLIYYRGSKYSVPIKYIGLTVKMKELDNKLYIYYNSNLISMHEIDDKIINYLPEDYIEGLKASITNKNIDIEALAAAKCRPRPTPHLSLPCPRM